MSGLQWIRNGGGRESAEVMLLGNDREVRRDCEDRPAVSPDHHGEFHSNIARRRIGVGLAAFGFLNPLFAAFIHVTSELVFILNFARLLPVIRGVEAGHG